MFILIGGDTHGNLIQAKEYIRQASDRKITHVIIVGDFGLWDHKFHGVKFLDDLNEYAEAMGVHVFAVGGNHENWDRWLWYVENNPTSKGAAYVRSHILLFPRAHQFTLAGKKFAVAGGAVSIDADRRRLSETNPYEHYRQYGWAGAGGGPRTEWWPNEQFTEADMLRTRQFGKADYLLSHDCSSFTPFKKRLKVDPESELHRKKIDEVLKIVNPVMHFHGHMHETYAWVNTLNTGLFGAEPEYKIQTYGLEADFSAMHGLSNNMDSFDNWGILDTDKDAFAFRGDGMNFRSLAE